jgi:3-phenylpropionate/trans-cinnamate dioxygenase ferredoxin subunit
VSEQWVTICGRYDLLPGEMQTFWAGDLAVLVVNHDGTLYALEDKCSHDDYELSAGQFDAASGSVECTLHGARFDVRDGAALCAPAYTPVRRYELRIEGDAVQVLV